MKARTVPRCRAEICRARNIFFLSRSTKRCNSVFFSLCHLQIVLLTIANTKIHYFYRNNDFNGDLTIVGGRKAPDVPCRALPLTLVAVYRLTFVLAAFLLESMARMILSWYLGMQWNILIIITHTLNWPFFMRCYSWTINWSVKLVHGPLAS